MTGRYPRGAIRRDYVRGGVGILLCAVPLMLMRLPPVTAVICLLLAVLFALHLWQTGLRRRTRITVDSRAIRDAANGICLCWDAVSSVVLRYFSVRRDGEAGWLELTLSGNGEVLKLDSRLDGFSEIARRAANAAANNRVALDSVTRNNFEALKIGSYSIEATDDRRD